MKVQSPRIERKQEDRKGGEVPGCSIVLVGHLEVNRLGPCRVQWQGRQKKPFSGAGQVSSMNEETS